MLRVECSCGNILKVSDDKAGKKVECPECEEMVLVKRASAVSTKPLPAGHSDADEEVVDDVEDIDDIDDVEGEVPAKKKGSAGCLLAIVGVAFVLLMVLVLAAGVGAYFLWFNKSDAPVASSPVPEASEAPAPANQENIAIRLQQPRKVGDVREVTLKGQQSTIGAPDPSGNDKVELLCKIHTLSVDSPSGQETGWELTVKRFTVTNQAGAATAPLPEGTVVQGMLSLVHGMPNPTPMKNISWQIKGNNTPVIGQTGAMLSRACGRELVGTENRRAYVDDDDAAFGTPDKQSVGGTWNANSAVINKMWLNTGLPANVVDVTGASGKLSNIAGGLAEVDITIDANVDSKKAGGVPGADMTGTLQVKLGYQIPLDNSQGPSKVTYILDARLNLDIKGMTVPVTHTESVVLDIRYLPNEPIVAAKDPAKPFVIKLTKSTAKWVAGANNAAEVAVSADYSITSGDAKGTSQYSLYLVYAGSSGKKEYLVASLPGTQMAFQPQGTMGGTVKGLEGVVPTANQLADLVLKEAPLKDLKRTTTLFTLSPVVIVGTPPTATPAGAKVQIELSGAKVERSGKSFKLHAAYKVVGGKLDTLAQYRWEVELAGSKIPKGAKDTLLTQPGSMEAKGTLTTTKDFTQDFGLGLTYTMRLVEDKGNVSTVVSTKDVTGEVTGSGEAPMPPVKLTATISASVLKNVMTVQYKLSGPADPNANYQFLYELKGGKGKNTGFQAPANMQQLLSGKQFQQEGTFSFPILVQGQNQYEVILLEFTAADPKGRRIGAFSGK